MLAVATVALRRFLRERSNLFFVFVLPFLIIFLVGYSSGTRTDSRLAVVGANTELGTSVLMHLPAGRIDAYADLGSALQAVGDTDVAAVAVFPATRTEPIEFRARPRTALDLRALLESAVAAENQRLVVDRQAAVVGVDGVQIAAAWAATGTTPISTESVGQVVWGGLDDIDASALTQVVLFMFLSALTSASFLVQDRSLGMARRKAAAPISITRLVVGETLGRFWISAFQAVLIVSVTGLLFGVSWGNPLATATILALFALVSTGVGILLGSAVDNPESANGAGIMISLVLAALGGAMAPVEVFPDVMQTIARFTPHYWAIDGLQSSLSQDSATGIGKPAGVLTASAIGVLALSTALYRRRTFAAR